MRRIGKSTIGSTEENIIRDTTWGNRSRSCELNQRFPPILPSTPPPPPIPPSSRQPPLANRPPRLLPSLAKPLASNLPLRRSFLPPAFRPSLHLLLLPARSRLPPSPPLALPPLPSVTLRLFIIISLLSLRLSKTNLLSRLLPLPPLSFLLFPLTLRLLASASPTTLRQVLAIR
jgi:hypothetical protein